jgi:molybdopterin molybdotransferase
VLTEDGLDLDFWKIAMKPGKPLIFGNWAGLPLVGVPGNPVSALVCALLYLKPALYALQGDKDPREANKTVPVILGQDLPKNGPRQDFMRARLERVDGQLRAFPFESQDSAKLSVLSAAGCLVIRTPNHEASKAGDTASAILISDI